MEKIQAAVAQRGPELVRTVGGVVVYQVSGDPPTDPVNAFWDFQNAGNAQIGDDTWTIDLKNGSGSVTRGRRGTPDLTVSMDRPTFEAVQNGTLGAQEAWMQGRLKVRGNMGLALKLQKLIKAALDAETPSSPSQEIRGGGAERKEAEPQLESGPTFDAIEDALASRGEELVRQIKGCILFQLTNPEAKITLDLRSGSGSVVRGDDAPSPDLTITIADADMARMARGELKAQQAFLQGKIRIRGKMALAMKLGKVLEAARPRSKL